MSSLPDPKPRTHSEGTTGSTVLLSMRVVRKEKKSSYLGDIGIADLCHDVADVLKDEEPGIQAPQVELVLHVIVYDLPTPHYVLETNKHRVGKGWVPLGEAKDESPQRTALPTGKAFVPLS